MTTLAATLLLLSIATLLFMMAVALRRKMHEVQTQNLASLEIIERFKFFQGKNLETFSRLLTTNNLSGIEQLIREKFEAQKKPNATTLATQMTQRLRS